MLSEFMELKLTSEENEYLAFVRDQKPDDTDKLDIEGLKLVGLTELEIQYIEFLFNSMQKYSTPVGSCKDKLRYLLWDLGCLPRTDNGVMTDESFMKSTCVSMSFCHDELDAGEYWCSLTSVMEREEGNEEYNKMVLFKIFSKISKYCETYADEHKLGEKFAKPKRDDDLDEIIEKNFPGTDKITDKQMSFLTHLENKNKVEVKDKNSISKKSACNLISFLSRGEVDKAKELEGVSIEV